AVLQGLAREINESKAGAGGTCLRRAAELAAVLGELAGALGVGRLDPAPWCRLAAPGSTAPGDSARDDAAIEAAIAARLAARKARYFEEADRVRDELAAAGVILEDKPGGTTVWRRK